MTSSIQTTIVHDVLDLIYEELVFSDIVQKLDDSYRRDVLELRNKWKSQQQQYEQIASVARRQKAWENDRKKVDDDI